MDSVRNVVLVVFDTLREDCIGYLGRPSWGVVRTPHLDRLGAESATITNSFGETLPTIPARRAIYTGKRVYPFREGMIREKGDFAAAVGWKGIDESHKTIAEVLQENGFTTGLVSDIQHMFKPSKNFHRGFDEWNWVRGYEVDNYRSGPRPSQAQIDYWLPKEIRDERYSRFLAQCLMNLDGIRVEEEYFVAQTMRQAARWLEQNRSQDRRFLVVESWSPHEPWFVPDHYRRMYGGEELPQQVLSLYGDVSHVSAEVIAGTRANYSGHVTMCDRWFGYLYETLENLGMLEDTLVLVTSDHGHSIGEDNYLGKRGYPSRPEVLRTPLILRHPDERYGRGKRSDMLVQHTDIPATIIEATGVRAREGDYYKWEDWVNVYDAMESEDRESGRLRMHGQSVLSALAEEREEFRDHVTVAWDTAVTVITERWWLNCKVNGSGPLLYDRSSSEPFTRNVADDHPEMVQELFDLALQDAGGEYPDFLIQLADQQKDAAGCSELAARRK